MEIYYLFIYKRNGYDSMAVQPEISILPSQMILLGIG
jgi:hypothetical protein